MWPAGEYLLLRAYPNNPLFTNLIDPSHEVLWTIVMGEIPVGRNSVTEFR